MDFVEQFEDHFRRRLISQNEQVQKMCDYLVEAGGKRVRPSIFFALAEDLVESKSGDINELLVPCFDVASGIEMIHQSSLVHDDLPSLDNDDYRRGKPTFHRAFSEGYAVLFGDWLLNRAFLVVSSTSLRTEVKFEILSLLFSANERLLEGQFFDLSEDSNPMNVARQKTAALFAAVFACPGVLVGVTREVKSSLYELGETFGMLFQIEDDLRDWEKDKTKLAPNSSFASLPQEVIEKTVSELLEAFRACFKRVKQVCRSELSRTADVLRSLSFEGFSLTFD